MPEYLDANAQTNNNKIKVGDKVRIRDYSYTLVLHKNGLKSCYNTVSQKFLVIATDCVLPADNQTHILIGSPKQVNNCILVSDSNETVLIQSRFLDKV